MTESGARVNLLGLDRDGLIAYCESLGEKKFRAILAEKHLRLLDKSRLRRILITQKTSMKEGTSNEEIRSTCWRKSPWKHHSVTHHEALPR